MKKVLALMLVFVMVLCVFVSCKKDPGDASNNTDSSVPAEYNWPSNLDYSGFGGYKFRILTWGQTGGDHWGAYEFYYNEALQGDVVNDAVLERDKKLEEKLNIEIEYNEQTKGDEMLNYARNSINAGSDDFDLLTVSINQAATLAKEGLLLDLNDYSDILNLKESYWDQSAINQFSIANHLYFTISDLTLVDKQATWAVFFTKSMVDKYKLAEGYENGLYSMVEEGDWTIEAMHNMCKTVSDDANGDGVMELDDVYGHIGEMSNYYMLMIGCGSQVIKKDANDMPVYCWTDNLDSIVTSYEHVKDIVGNQDISMLSGRMIQLGIPEADVWSSGFGGMMEREEALFNVTGMNRCKLYRDLECEFGILPLPKADKGQESYYSALSMGQADTVSIPLTSSDPERTATILEAMTALASQTTYTAYIDRALTYKYLRDDDSAAMLDIIFDNRVYDAADVYGWGSGNNKVFGSGPAATSIPTQINSFKKMTENAIEKGIEAFEKIYNNTGKN